MANKVVRPSPMKTDKRMLTVSNNNSDPLSASVRNMDDACRGLKHYECTSPLSRGCIWDIEERGNDKCRLGTEYRIEETIWQFLISKLGHPTSWSEIFYHLGLQPSYISGDVKQAIRHSQPIPEYLGHHVSHAEWERLKHLVAPLFESIDQFKRRALTR